MHSLLFDFFLKGTFFKIELSVENNYAMHLLISFLSLCFNDKRDPTSYPNPEEFRPERFNAEEQRNRQSTVYLGFGEGPRICLGMRFAMLQIKVALAHITLNMRIKLSPRHKPIVLDPQTLLSLPKDGILVQFENR